jgi:hypothetical protein
VAAGARGRAGRRGGGGRRAGGRTVAGARLSRRLARLDAWGRARRADAEGGAPIIVALPDGWPAGDRAAFDGDDPAARADAIARRTGQRPGRRTTLVVFRTRPDGPQ